MPRGPRRATLRPVMAQSLPAPVRASLLRPTRTLRELLLLSDFARANPARAEELLERCANPTTETRNA